MNEVELKTSIRSLLSEDLDPDELASDPRGVTGGAVKLFQRLFVEHLHFDRPTAAMDELGEDLPTDDWSKYALAEQAYIIAEHVEFRVVYIELEKLTRTAQRHAISSMLPDKRRTDAGGWIREGEFLAIFHAPDSDIWHIVSPYAEEGHEVGDGPTILRRYVVGRGENHRTVTENLAKMDADAPEPLFDLVQEAFRLRPVTEEFYESYKKVFGRLDGHLREQGFEIEEAKRYAHLTLNRLMFLYFIQKKGWLNGDKQFMDWFTEQYEDSDDEGCFHERWLSALFFDSMNTPEGTEIEADLPEDIRDVLRGLPFFNGGLFEREELDCRDAHFPDRLVVTTVIRSFLETYNFTVSEESAFDLDVAVDPAMLGKIYESLIAEQERGEAGIFYTPRVEVDLMCRLGLYDQLVQRLDDTSEEALIEFLFTPLEQWEGDSLDSEEVISTLHDMDIVDPACGSGAFIVGMMQVLLDLHRKLDVTPDYNLKEQLVNDSLYGVDIKDWAVRVAEFRLWLSLVEAEEGIPGARPVLPNLSMKLRIGDSIVQKAGNEFIRLDDIGRRADTETQDKLDDLQDLKERFFLGERDLQDEIKETQKEILLEHLTSRVDYLEQEKSRQRQTNLAGEVTEAAEERMQELQEEIEALEHTRTLLAEDSALFIWGLDFPEVMLRGGFDIVIGNPPYVRNENIVNQGIDPQRLEEYDEDYVEELKKGYKQDLIDYVKQAFDVEPGGQIDLYSYFFFKGVDLLEPGGTLVLITSNSWLDTEFGHYIQDLLLRHCQPEYIFDNVAKRSFEEADINTIITTARKRDKETLDGSTAFLSIKRPFEEITVDHLQPILTSKGTAQAVKVLNESALVELSEDYRRVALEDAALWRIGDGEVNGGGSGIEDPEVAESESRPRGSYDGAKWGQFIHAPDIFFDILDKADDNLTTLGDLGKVDSGINTRANRFFYLHKVPKAKRGEVEIKNHDGAKIPDKCHVVKSKIGTWKGRGCVPEVEPTYWLVEDEYLRPAVRTPREFLSILIDVDSLSRYILTVREDWPDLEGTYVRDYIDYCKGSKKVTRKSDGEEIEVLQVHKRPELSKRKQSMDDGSDAVWWYEVIDKNYSRILLPKSIGYNFRTGLTSELVPVDNRFYCHLFHGNEDELIGLTLYLNSTLMSLSREVYGRSNLGQGGLDTQGVDWQMMPCPTRGFLPQIRKAYGDAEDLLNRQIGDIWDEADHKDKKKLDEVVLEVLGIDPDKAEELQEETVALVRARQERAQSR